ncbi:hypothetical protein HOLleu_38815 [Holothuria leucospilota]|uniref:Uncharacterized protein n=1 Tax=Holothuria leucospilota TaxID=206669 RepID=A0A9Q0YHR9_HOLLE|nr:hypothetical protein HOLleu_38815 [Holothuria leucospilota]
MFDPNTEFSACEPRNSRVRPRCSNKNKKWFKPFGVNGGGGKDNFVTALEVPRERVQMQYNLSALSLFARGTSSYATARCRSTTLPPSTCMHYQPLDQTRIPLSKGL